MDFKKYSHLMTFDTKFQICEKKENPMSDILTLWKQNHFHLRIFTIFAVIKCMYDKRKSIITHSFPLFEEATQNKRQDMH